MRRRSALAFGQRLGGTNAKRLLPQLRGEIRHASRVKMLGLLALPALRLLAKTLVVASRGFRIS